MLVTGKVAMFGLDATLPEFRGRGCQSALITRRLIDAARSGCELIAAEVWDGHPASEAAASVLEEAGFKQIAGRRNWRRPKGIAPS
jgi:GNAT superfamily N-acetyltransferase